MLIFAGPHGAGKTEASKLISHYGFVSIDLGPTLRDIYRSTNPEISLSEWCKIGESEYGPNFTDQILVGQIKKLIKKYEGAYKNINDIILVGSRSLNGIKYIQQNLEPINDKSYNIIYITSPREILRERYFKKEGVKAKNEDFQSIIDADKALGLETIIGNEDYALMNTGSIDDFKKSLEKLLFSELGYKSENLSRNEYQDYINNKFNTRTKLSLPIETIMEVNDSQKWYIASTIRMNGQAAFALEEFPYVSANLNPSDAKILIDNVNNGRKSSDLPKPYSNLIHLIKHVSFPSELLVKNARLINNLHD